MLRGERPVLFATARLAADIGFADITHEWYNPDGHFYGNQTGFSDNSNRHRISAPKQAVLGNFLRKQYLVSAGAFDAGFGAYYWSIEHLVLMGWKRESVLEKRWLYDTWEDAMEDCLQAAISEIKLRSLSVDQS